MQLDVVTLFPEWFDWFRGVRHVRNAIEGGHELRTLNPRDHSTLSGRVVDDTPFGGGAGMVLRVDVMDAALQGFYGVDPVELKTQRRVIALVPGGRVLDDGSLVPMVRDCVRSVDIDRKRIEIDRGFLGTA